MAIENREVPSPTPGHALVAVKAFAVNYADSLAIRGKYQVKHELPFVTGSELAGEVVSVEGSCDILPGERIMAQVDGGAAAEFCLVPLHRLRRAPPGLSVLEAAAVSVTYPTAHLALFEPRSLAPGAVVLVHAGAGGVGSAAIQLAVRAGATVIATAGSSDKLEAARALGAQHVFNYRQDGWDDHVRELAGPAGVEVVVDTVGGDAARRSMRLLGWRGRHAVVGFASGEIPQIAANRLLAKAAHVAGIWWSPERDQALLDHVHQDLYAGFANGSLKPLIGAVMAFEKYDEAVELVATGRSIGKVVVAL